MRLWSLHPSLLDAKGLVACWRETLLAQKVLAGQTKGYTAHPQLVRFRAVDQPLAVIGRYLQGLWDEAANRGYHFDPSRIREPHPAAGEPTLALPSGQAAFERQHLLSKLLIRDPQRAEPLRRLGVQQLPLHPLFHLVPGSVEPWEKDTAITRNG